MKNWIKDIYIMVLKHDVKIKHIGIFPATPSAPKTSAIHLGDAWGFPHLDKRYMKVQDYIDRIKNGMYREDI